MAKAAGLQSEFDEMRIDPLIAEPPVRVRVHYFTNERSVSERLYVYFFKNQKTSHLIRCSALGLKLLACLLYMIRVVLDSDPYIATCQGCTSYHYTDPDAIRADLYLQNSTIFYPALLWVIRPPWLWILETIVATISLTYALIRLYITSKNNWLKGVLDYTIYIELITTFPFLLTIFVPKLRNLFIPSFLGCWLGKIVLGRMLIDLNRGSHTPQSAFYQQMMSLCSTLFCLLFTSTCGIQHLQRAGQKNMDLFQSFYFTIVTFSTVGYGEFYPDIWISQLFIIIIVCLALVVLPSQLEQLASTFTERQKSGGTYTVHRRKNEEKKHVVVVITTLKGDTIGDFLNEFYAHSKLQDYSVIILSRCELDAITRHVLQIPMWSEKVKFLQGSALKDFDLERARMTEAAACFILANRNFHDKTVADQHTIIRSWAIKDFAPQCSQYVTIFRPESKMHVKHADYVICEDEFKYALLANNCLCPGLSTFLTLLLHTSRGEEGQTSMEDWHRKYGKHSGNEVYHIQVAKSKFFGPFEGKSFTYASFHAHRRFGVALIAIQKDCPGSTLLLNPGPRVTLNHTDICYYIAITKEENSSFVINSTRQLDNLVGGTKIFGLLASVAALGRPIARSLSKDRVHTPQLGSKHTTQEMKPLVVESENETKSPAKHEFLAVEESLEPSRRSSIASVLSILLDDFQAKEEPIVTPEQTSAELFTKDTCGPNCAHNYTNGYPPVTPYIGTSATLCYLLKERKSTCCLELANVCDHCKFRDAKEYGWKTRAIIVAADFASNGIYNFIVPLRANFRAKHDLNPIVLLLETKPQIAFLDAISYFPDVYWMKGSIDSLDDLLRAGINLADHVVIVNKENSSVFTDEYLADCNTIVAVQTIHRLFPSVKIITDISYTSNMRFMQFNAKDLYALHQSNIEKKERERGSHISYMFRLPFAAGHVFSASMLDTLLYQGFVKDYLIQLVRLLLGIDQARGSGYLSSMKLEESDLWLKTYGRLYQKLCSSTGDIPIGIYRTEKMRGGVIPHEAREVSITLNDESQADLFNRRFSTKYLMSERREILKLVKCRMENLGLPEDEYTFASDKRGSISYPIINPNFDTELQYGDIIYLLKPSTQPWRVNSSLNLKEKAKEVGKSELAKKAHFSETVEIADTSGGSEIRNAPVQFD